MWVALIILILWTVLGAYGLLMYSHIRDSFGVLRTRVLIRTDILVMLVCGPSGWLFMTIVFVIYLSTKEKNVPVRNLRKVQ